MPCGTRCNLSNIPGRIYSCFQNMQPITRDCRNVFICDVFLCGPLQLCLVLHVHITMGSARSLNLRCASRLKEVFPVGT